MEGKILTLHPDVGKSGVRISQEKYDQIRDEILATISERGEIAFMDLVMVIEHKLAFNFDGSVGWYVTTVKLDLEARGLIERVKGSKPQRLRLVSP